MIVHLFYLKIDPNQLISDKPLDVVQKIEYGFDIVGVISLMYVLH